MFTDAPEAVVTFLMEAGFGAVTAVTPVTGGNINPIQRLHTANATFILKQSSGAESRLFACEAAGLQVVREAGIRTPDVYLFAANFLLLEDLGSHSSNNAAWEEFGRAVARQHLHTNDRFGFAYDNFLGPLPQINTWADNGHDFFGQQRVLRYLSEPLCAQSLTKKDRQDVERLVSRLPDLVLEQPPALLHGDLWHTNMLVDAQGNPALIDTAVYFGWPEVELSMTRQYGQVPRIFFDAYNEVNPLQEGWWQRLELLTIRQNMAVLAFFGNAYNTLEQLRAVLRKFG